MSGMRRAITYWNIGQHVKEDMLKIETQGSKKVQFYFYSFMDESTADNARRWNKFQLSSFLFHLIRPFNKKKRFVSQKKNGGQLTRQNDRSTIPQIFSWTIRISQKTFFLMVLTECQSFFQHLVLELGFTSEDNNSWFS